MHTHKLPTHRDTVISYCGKYFDLYLVLITVFAQLSISLRTLHDKFGFFFFNMICKTNVIFRPEILIFCAFMTHSSALIHTIGLSWFISYLPRSEYIKMLILFSLSDLLFKIRPEERG